MISVNGKTTLFAVLGDPIEHSASPLMHNTGFKALNLNHIYVPFHVKSNQLETAVKGLKALNVGGFNVTVPHKENILPLLDEVDPYAQAIGAVNTVVNLNGTLKGYNTDGEGLLLSLHHEIKQNPSQKNIVILGAGGSAKAIAHALAKHSVKTLTVVNRTLEKASELVKQLPCPSKMALTYTSSELHSTLKNAHWVIHTTSVGLWPKSDACVLNNFEWISPQHFCYDTVYKPQESLFLKQCAAKGAQTLNGLGMLAGQGVLAFELFTQQKINYSLFKDVLC